MSLYPQEFRPRCSVFSLRLLWASALSPAPPPRSAWSTSTTGPTTWTRRRWTSSRRQTGIKVVYDTYDNNEIVETKLLAGKSGYDIVVPSGPFVQRLIGAKVFQKLDKAKLPNLANQWPEVTQRLAVFDPGNQYAVNYMWGTTGIGLNVEEGARTSWATCRSTPGTWC